MSTNKLILAGTQLANIAYNLQQNEALPLHVRQSMSECYKAWDDALQEQY